MNTIFLPFFLFNLFLVGSLLDKGSTQKIVMIDPQSLYVEIHGSTNVNNFNCSYKADLPENKFEVKLIRKGGFIEIQHEPLLLEVRNFQCPHSQMTDDLHDLLEYEDYPNIVFQLTEISNKKTAHIMIEMAGEKQNYELKVDNNTENNRLTCKAIMQLCLKDFGLEAPEKFFGMIKVDEEIEVEFKIDMKVFDK